MPNPKIDNSFAWALAATPLLGLLFNVIFALRGMSSPLALWGFLLASLVVGITLAIADAFRLRAAGVRASVALAILLTPIYLFIRSSRGRQGFVIPIAWCVACGVSVAGFLVVPHVLGVPIDTQAVERSISSSIRRQAGVALAVNCGSGLTVRPGETFQCTATADDKSVVMVDVTVQNSAGDFIWEVRDTGSAPRASGGSDPEQPDDPPSNPGDGEPADVSDPPLVAGLIRPVQATASSTAAGSLDDAGNPVTFIPGNAIDGVHQTAWRPVEGDGVGQTFALELGGTYTLTTVGLIPGYDKVDALTGLDRFFQNRRIEQVRWYFDDGSSVTQRFADSSSLQTIEVSEVTSTVSFEILATRAPQGTDPRNFAPVSEVEVWGAR